ncbi:unnamed protein product [Linum tenue]|uniref:Uncharacterized protein n=1 Tax=Linum tenue TaxID=586396 RepID=A0AAV0J4P2_9ROSI|nr:unnamed protein product [Linum tenue]
MRCEKWESFSECIIHCLYHIILFTTLPFPEPTTSTLHSFSIAPKLPTMAGGDGDTKLLHIAMFPWLAFGHILPFLQLAKIMAKKGHKISFVSTPRNIDRLPQLPPSLITFVKLPLPPVDGLPTTAEATSDLEIHAVSYLKRAYDLLQQPLAGFLRSSRPDWILFDYVPFWLPGVARDLGIPTAYFSIFLAGALGFVSPPSDEEEDYRKSVEEFTVKPKWVPFDSDVAYRQFEAEKVFPALVGDDLQLPEFYRFHQTLKRCDLIAVRSCPELESKWFDLLQEIHQKPVIPVGVLPTPVEEKEADSWQTSTWIKEWLDRQEPGSVVYVAFGSEAKRSQEELTEIAWGLEMSGLPFFWVLRTRRSPDDPDVLELPEGFEERTRGLGVVWKDWAPQLRILGHDSVGGFLTHSGWSSVVEALSLRRALILLTFYSDQGINARVLEERELGYCIPRDESDGSFTRDSVAESLRVVMVSEEGKIYRDRAKEMSGLFGDRGRQSRYVDNLLAHLLNNE